MLGNILNFQRVGTHTLPQASLFSLPTYQFFVLKAPTTIYKNIEKIWRNFLWGSNLDNITSYTSHLFNWDIVTSPKEKGGLGISKLKSTNNALLCKWLWRYLMEPNALWRKIINAKYSASFIGDIPSNGKHCSLKALWMSIIKSKLWFESNFKWQINNGENSSFWHGRWNEENSLTISFPRLYVLCNSKNEAVNEVQIHISNDWSIKPKRALTIERSLYWTT